eukprot:CAMPEP_0116879416 /NCGR_PEP_ID=MMETSP0463-20121206/11230_1 /TAXON_ID=181622 /ORGANISM="Strombidinopsis sp, Strain SopsisLIS2011" /LENGTH=48 /DNA_ID= /DNA_START= /DNA_END= /DNA_ORIENTATION=
MKQQIKNRKTISPLDMKLMRGVLFDDTRPMLKVDDIDSEKSEPEIVLS